MAFTSTKENGDTSTPAGKLIFQVMAAIGRFARALIGERIRSGLEPESSGKSRGSASHAGHPGRPQRDAHTGLVIPFEGLALAA